MVALIFKTHYKIRQSSSSAQQQLGAEVACGV